MEIFDFAKIPARRLKRYFVSRLKHLTFKKLFNLCLIERQLFTKESFARGYPYELVIDPTNICQLKCPLCFTGMGKSGRPKGQMKFEVFKKIIDEIGKYAFHLFLHNWSEPLLFKDICKFIHYARNSNIGVTISSNLSFHLSEKQAEDIIKSGLETLVISLDGANQETYLIYRVGGDLDKVLSNIRLLVSKKKELKSRTPFLEWQFLMMRHNENEISVAKQMAKELKIDSIVFVKINLPHGCQDDNLVERWFPENKKLRIKQGYDIADNVTKKCWWLWRVTVINYDGGVSPCCYVDDMTADFGNITNESFKNIWNNKYYLSARNLFGNKQDDPMIQTICHRCNVGKRAIGK